MTDYQFVLLIATSPLLLVTLGIGIARHRFLSTRFAVASITTIVGGICVGWASSTALYYILSMTSPGFPGIGGGFIVGAFGIVASVAMATAVGIWFPPNPPDASEDPFSPSGCIAIVLLVPTVVPITEVTSQALEPNLTRFVLKHGWLVRREIVSADQIYGQESNPTTRRLAMMNLAIRGIDGDIGKEHADRRVWGRLLQSSK